MRRTAAYYDRLKLAYRDFAIVCHQRTGSHLLATALDSHPEIHCQGELLQLLLEPHKLYASVCQVATGAKNGAIIMYNQWEIALALGLVPRKIIHLQRNPRRTAYSCIRNELHLSLHGPRHRPHALRASGAQDARDYPVDEKQLSDWERLIARAQQEFGRVLPADCLDISYEELCLDRDVQQLEPAPVRRLIDFLGVASVGDLTTSLAKTTPTPLRPLLGAVPWWSSLTSFFKNEKNKSGRKTFLSFSLEDKR
jgi:Sulfotransferase family